MKTIKIGDDSSAYASGNYNCKTSTTGTSIPKQKPKELDWEKEFSRKYYDIFAAWKKQGYVLDLENNLKDFIKQTLTQQRTELLEEIKKIVEEQLFWYEGEDYSSITAREALNQVKNLLNKKDAK